MEICKYYAHLSVTLSGEVLMPSGKSAQPLISDNLDGTVTVQYSPTEAGLHEMHIKYNGTHIPGEHTHAHTLRSHEHSQKGEIKTSGVHKKNCCLV